MRKLILIIVAFVIYTNTLKAQDSTLNYVDTGLGMGLNYGGFGCSIAFAITPYMSIEGNCGFNLLDLVGGGALNIYIIPKNNTKFYSLAIKGMYGYNAALIRTYNNFGMESRAGESFYGFSFGLINEFRFGRKKSNGINIGIIRPLRTEEFDKSYNDMVDSGYEMTSTYPILVSIGFHVEFKR